MFISDAVGELFGQALAEAAERGVHVKVLYDAMGSWTSRRGFFESLRQRGVDIRPFKPLSLGRGLRYLVRRDHRKILVVDGEVAFVGGVNISAHWAPLGEGRARAGATTCCASRARRCTSWSAASWPPGAWPSRSPGAAPQPAAAGCGGCGGRGLAAGRCACGALQPAQHPPARTCTPSRRARRSVLIAAAYFVPDRRMVAVLREAAQRGVEVSLLLNGRSDHPFLRALHARLLREAAERGRPHLRVAARRAAREDGGGGRGVGHASARSTWSG